MVRAVSPRWILFLQLVCRGYGDNVESHCDACDRVAPVVFAPLPASALCEFVEPAALHRLGHSQLQLGSLEVSSAKQQSVGSVAPVNEAMLFSPSRPPHMEGAVSANKSQLVAQTDHRRVDAHLHPVATGPFSPSHHDVHKVVSRHPRSPLVAGMILLGFLIVMLLCMVFCLWGGFVAHRRDLQRMVVESPTSYNLLGLLTWEVCLELRTTVWHNTGLVRTVQRLAGIALAVAFLELLVVPNAHTMDPLRFSQIGAVFDMFVPLLLGFFLSASLGRWFDCMTGLLRLIDAVKNLQLMLHSLGVSIDKIDQAMRYGVLSGWLLAADLRNKGSVEKMDGADLAVARQRMWTEMLNRKQPLSYLLPEEKTLLEEVSDPACQMWTLIGSLMGRLAQDGEIPPMASPTYSRIVSFVETAQDGMRQMRVSIGMLTPYTYTHTLALIVHLSNMLAAISFGLTLGVCTASFLVHFDPQLRVHGLILPAASFQLAGGKKHFVIVDIQDLLIQLFRCFFAPILYQAFLEIGISVSSPFICHDAAIPVELLLDNLEKDLQDGNRVAKSPPFWECAHFKTPRT